MTEIQQAIILQINTLRMEYADADEAQRTSILEKIEALKREHNLTKCKQCKRLMFNNPRDPHYPFHNEACHTTWADAHYGKVGEPKGRPSIAEMQRRLNEMGKEAHLKKITDKQQPL